MHPGLPSPSMTAIRWLHIADLHLGARSEAEVDQLVGEFLDSLARRPAGVATIDLVLVSGDITHTGSHLEFAAATRIITRILAVLPAALMIPVPGNHDVRRPDDDAALAYGSFDDYDEGEANRHVRTLRRQLWEDPKSKLVECLFGDYQVWFAEFVRPRLTGRSGVTLHESAFPGDLRVDLTFPGKPPLTVVALNSAWRGYQDAPQRGHLTVAPEQLFRVTPAVRMASHAPSRSRPSSSFITRPTVSRCPHAVASSPKSTTPSVSLHACTGTLMTKRLISRRAPAECRASISRRTRYLGSRPEMA